MRTGYKCLFHFLCVPAQPAAHSRWAARQKDSDPLQWLCGGGQSSGLWQESRQALDSALSSRQGVCVLVRDTEKMNKMGEKKRDFFKSHTCQPLWCATYPLYLSPKQVDYLGQSDNRFTQILQHDLLLSITCCCYQLISRNPLFPLVCFFKGWLHFLFLLLSLCCSKVEAPQWLRMHLGTH